MLQMLGIVFVGVLAMYGPAGVSAHGRLVEPASRNSMWRYNYKNPRNYNDMGLNCGGFTVSTRNINLVSLYIQYQL